MTTPALSAAGCTRRHFVKTLAGAAATAAVLPDAPRLFAQETAAPAAMPGKLAGRTCQ